MESAIPLVEYYGTFHYKKREKKKKKEVNNVLIAKSYFIQLLITTIFVFL